MSVKPAHRKRLRLVFGVAVLAVLVVGLSATTPQYLAARNDAVGIRYLRDVGCLVRVYHHTPPWPWKHIAPIAPFFERVLHLSLQGDAIDESCLRVVSGLDRLAELELRDVPPGIQGYDVLAEGPRLRVLSITGPVFSNALSRALLSSPGLERLALRSTGITDADLVEGARRWNLELLVVQDEKHITASFLSNASFPRLRALSLFGCPIGDAGARHLSGLQGVTELVLGNTGISNEGIPMIAHLELTSLDLSENAIDGHGLVHLEKMRSLRSLRLIYTRVGDECIPVLSRMSWLEDVGLEASRVTHSGAQALRRALPHTKVSH